MLQSYNIQKLYVRMVILTCLFSGSLMAQDKTIAYGEPNVRHEHQPRNQNKQTLGVLLSDIEKAHGVSFVCKSELLDIMINTGKMNFSGKRYAENLQKLLVSLNMQVKQITNQQFVIFKVQAPVKTTAGVLNSKDDIGNIALTDNELNNQYSLTSFTTNTIFNKVNEIVTGTIIARNKNMPLEGVTVSVKGTTLMTITDKNGRYSISVPERKTILVFSFVGYVSQEVAINKRQSIDIIMEEDTHSLSEVVVIAFGTLDI